MHFLLHDTQVTDKALGPLVQFHISSPEFTFPKTFDVAVDISTVYNMYLFQVKHFSNKGYSRR
jgi:hypothetical protein